MIFPVPENRAVGAIQICLLKISSVPLISQLLLGPKKEISEKRSSVVPADTITVELSAVAEPSPVCACVWACTVFVPAPMPAPVVINTTAHRHKTNRYRFFFISDGFLYRTSL